MTPLVGISRILGDGNCAFGAYCTSCIIVKFTSSVFNESSDYRPNVEIHAIRTTRIVDALTSSPVSNALIVITRRLPVFLRNPSL